LTGELVLSYNFKTRVLCSFFTFWWYELIWMDCIS